MRLFIIRHADPDYANNTITPRGHIEAAALGRRMAKLGVDRLYTSPLGRARDTAGYISEATGVAAEVEAWTAELSDWTVEPAAEGYSMAWDVPGAEVRAREPLPTAEDWHSRAPFVRPVYRLEYDKLCLSSDSFLSRHGYVREGGSYRVVDPSVEKIVMVCHGGFGLTLLSHLLQIPLTLMWAGFYLWPSSVTTVLFDERSPGRAAARCIGLADVSHLLGEGIEPSPHGIKANTE